MTTTLSKPTTLDALDRALGSRGEAVALVATDGAEISGAALLDKRRAWAQAVDAIGLTPAHRVATRLPNGTDTAITLLSLLDRVNLLPMNPDLTPRALRDQIEAAQVDAVIVADARAAARLRGELGPDGPAVLPLGPDGILAPGTPTMSAPRQAREPGLVLHTSGSTGAPKRVPLTTEQLVLSARNIAAHLDLGPEDRAIHALPMFHVGAVVDLLLAPLLAGGSVGLARDLSSGAIRDAVRRGATWLQLVPTALGHLLDDLEGAPLSGGLRFLRMVSADLSEDLRMKAEDQLGLPLIQMYGMTETAGQITSNPLPPRARKPLSVGIPAGADVAIIDDQGALVAQGREGEVCVRGPTVTAGYEGEAETPRHGEWLRTGDLGRFDDEGYLFLTGRLKEIINRGGEKISPVPVERAARALPGVSDAVAFALPHPSLGEQVGLAVVANADIDEARLLAGLADTLAEFERPRRVTFLDSLPKLASGKVDRRAVARMAEGCVEAADPHTGLAAVVADTWSKALGSGVPHEDTDFFDAGGDSLSATDFLMSLEKELGRPMPPNLLFEAPRFAQLVDRLNDDAPAEEEPPLVRHIRTRTAGWAGQRVGPRGIITARNTVARGTKIIFGSHGDGPPNAFGPTLGKSHPLFMLRTSRDVAPDYRAFIDPITTLYAEELAALLEPGEPVILAGFCGGANLVEHLAPKLEAQGHPVQLFVAIDWIFDTPTRFPVLYLWTRYPVYSAAAQYRDPRRGFAYLHPAGADYLPLAGTHQGAMKKSLFAALEDAARPYLEGLPPPVHSAPEDMDKPTRAKRYRARIRAASPWVLRDGSTKTLRLRIKNTSRETWPATKDSGLQAVVYFQSAKGRDFTQTRQYLSFDHPVAPGESFVADTQIAWPGRKRRAPLRLIVQMQDDGIAHFGKWWRPVWRRQDS